MTSLFRILAAATAFASMAMTISPAHGETKTLRWILNGPAMSTWTTDPTAVTFFANTQPFVIVPKTSNVTIPGSWNAVRTRIFSSYKEFDRAVSSGSIDPQVKAVLYDNEAWQFTPGEEQDNFADYVQRFAELAHKHGYLVIITPAINLATKQQNAGERRFDTFLRLNIPANAARYADVFEIQAQGSQSPASVYARYIKEAADQARAANPKVLVFAGLSTNPSGHKVTSGTIVGAINATRDFVDGYWFNVPKQNPTCPNCTDFRPDMALDVMRQLQSSH